jgi:DNA-binding response OmpR family regulator
MSDAQGRILIVDDEPDVVEVLTTYFSLDARFEIMTAHQGADAVMIADFRRPDAVLLDILMPGMDGIQVLRAIRALDPSIPMVMLTANADEKIARDTFTMGAFDYVSKPFDFDVLDRVVTAAVAAGIDRKWSLLGVNRAAPHARSLRVEQVAGLIRNGILEQTASTTPRRAIAI